MATYTATCKREFEFYAQIAKPGDIVQIAYPKPSDISVKDLHGESGNPIVITIKENDG